jgi:hypothetical protein
MRGFIESREERREDWLRVSESRNLVRVWRVVVLPYLVYGR